MEPVPAASFLWVKTLSTCGTSDGGAIGVATFLEASLVETLLGLPVDALTVAWRGGSMQVANLKGVVEFSGGDRNHVGGQGLS